jgi:hypothetical protein
VEPLAHPPDVPEGDDSINTPDAVEPVTSELELADADDLDEDDVEDGGGDDT